MNGAISGDHCVFCPVAWHLGRVPDTFSIGLQDPFEASMATQKRTRKTSETLSGTSPVPAPEHDAATIAPAARASAGGQKAALTRVLLVDDDSEIVESMRTVLESRGYEILVARDGNQGLAMAEKEEPDLVVLDMMMPKRSGFLVLEKLRRSRSVPMRVIMITANEGSRHKAYAEMLGVDDYIRKPFAMDRLLESIDRLLS